MPVLFFVELNNLIINLTLFHKRIKYVLINLEFVLKMLITL